MCGIEQVLEEEDVAWWALDGLDHEGIECAPTLVLHRRGGRTVCELQQQSRLVVLTSALASQVMNFSLDIRCSKAYRRGQGTGEGSRYTGGGVKVHRGGVKVCTCIGKFKVHQGQTWQHILATHPYLLPNDVLACI